MSPTGTSDHVQEHLERCLVEVLVDGQHSGTGFFVAPGRVLTCAHVVRPPRETTLVWQGGSFPAQVLQRLPDLEKPADPYPYPDLALLGVDIPNHPCVRLDLREPSLGPPPDSFRTAGFTEVFEKGLVRRSPIDPYCSVPGRISLHAVATALQHSRDGNVAGWRSEVEMPAAGFEPAPIGLKELWPLSVWPELGFPARSDQELICIRTRLSSRVANWTYLAPAGEDPNLPQASLSSGCGVYRLSVDGPSRVAHTARPRGKGCAATQLTRCARRSCLCCR